MTVFLNSKFFRTFSLIFLCLFFYFFTHASQIFAGGCTCNPPASNLDTSYTCSNSNDNFFCSVNGNSVTYGTIYCSGVGPGGTGLKLIEGNCSCTDSYNAQQVCGAPTCKRQSEGCSKTTDCCNGFTCNASGKCTTACSEFDNQTACADNGGTWTNKTFTKANSVCIATNAFNGGWCKQGSCSEVSGYACRNSLAPATEACMWAPDWTGDPNKVFSCYQCTCPPIPTCTNMQSLKTTIGYATNDITQNQINNLANGSTGPCNGQNITWIPAANLSAKIPAAVGATPINTICIRGTATPSVNGIVLKDISSNVTISASANNNTGYSYKIGSIRTNRPGKYNLIQASRPESGGYCQQSGTAFNFCTFTSSQVSNGYPNTILSPTTNGINMKTPAPMFPPKFLNKSVSSTNTGKRLAWSHTVGDNTNGLLLVAISYRGPAGITIDPAGVPTFNNLPLTLVPNSLSKIDGKRYTEYWYLVNPPKTTANIVVKLSVDAKEIIGTALNYEQVNQTTPFQGSTAFTASGTTNCGNACTSAFSEIYVNPTGTNQLVVGTITAQTPEPSFRTNIATLRANQTENGNLNSQTAELLATATPVNLRWRYNYTNGVWAISSVILNPVDGMKNTIYWQTNWGNACGGNNNRTFLTVTQNGTNTIVVNNKRLTNNELYYDLSSSINTTPTTVQTYSWRIDTNNGSGLITGPTWQFAVNATAPVCTPSAPSAPTLSTVTPTGNVAILNWTAPTNWGINCPTNTNTYSLYLKKGSTFTGTETPIATNYTLTNSTQGSLEYGATYFWKVAASNGFGTTQSSVGTFTIATPSYFQTLGGGVTALGYVINPLLAGNYVSKNDTTYGLAGIITMGNTSSSSISSGSYSQQGTIPGWNRAGLVGSYPKINTLTYDNLYKTIFANANVISTETPDCRNGFFDSGDYQFVCYSATSPISSNGISANKTTVFIPTTATTNYIQNTNLNFQGNKKVIIFINGDYTTPTTTNIDANSGTVFVIKGNLNTGSTTNLDGVYIFSGNLITGNSTSPLTGLGSLISLSQTMNLSRKVTPAVSESWTYQGKYLWLFRNILTTPSYSWKELPPQD